MKDMYQKPVVCFAITLLFGAVGFSLDLEDEFSVDCLKETSVVRRVNVAHDVSPGYIVTSVAFIGQSMSLGNAGCRPTGDENYTRYFDVLTNGDIIVTADIRELIYREINIVINSQFHKESWQDHVVIHVVDGSGMIRFPQNSYVGHVFENLPSGSIVRDLDNLYAVGEGVEGRSLRYALVDGRNDLFELLRDDYDGTLQILTRDGLDYESESQYLLTIAAVIHGSNVEPVFTRVWVIVDNVNDNEPQMSSLFYEGRVNASDEPGREITTVHATDADGDVLTYHIFGRHGSFGIHKHNGSIFLSKSGYRLQNDIYEFQVYASDGVKIPSQFAAVRITVGGQQAGLKKPESTNRKRREFRSRESMTVKIPESLIGEVVDLDNNYYEIFALKEPAPSMLEINAATGVVRLRAGEKFDYETQHEIVFTVIITRVDDPSC